MSNSEIEGMCEIIKDRKTGKLSLGKLLIRTSEGDIIKRLQGTGTQNDLSSEELESAIDEQGA